MLLLENISHGELKKFIKEFYNYALSKLDVDRPPKLIFRTDKTNAKDMFGKTGFYDADSEKIVLYISQRHAKDVLRSFAHELIHHEQKCKGLDDSLDLSKTATDPAYASNDEGLREMERDAFERGNMLFRDWCDMKKLERKQIMAEAKKLKVKVLKEKEMTGPEIKKAHALGKKLKGKKGIDEPYALSTWMVQKGKAEEMEEAAKPDFLDLDKDGDKEEPMKKAAKEAEKHKEVKEAGVGFGEGPEGKEKLQESKEVEPTHPYPELFAKQERLMQDKMNKHEELVFQELLKRVIKQ